MPKFELPVEIDGEPVFLLRAQDACAVEALWAYYAACVAADCVETHTGGVSDAIDRFRGWQADHETKIPD